MQKIELLSFPSADELAQAAAGRWLDEIETANLAAKIHGAALSGGRITQKFFAATVEEAKTRKISFAGAHFFWADERCVPPTDPESNFKLANELLFTPLNIAGNQIHRIHGEIPSADALKMAETELRSVITSQRDDYPVLDLIFLGMGEDGHVASLFPNASVEILDCRAPFLFVETSPKPPPRRISLSYTAIAAAKSVWVLASGAGKEAAFRESLSATGKTPLARVIQSRLSTKIFTDIRPN